MPQSTSKSPSRRLRSWLRALEPRVLDSLNGRRLKKLRPWLDQHDVFSFNREPLARGVAFGMFCGLFPAPIQIIGSLMMCARLRGNAIAAAITTAYTNPLTIVPFYWLAFQASGSVHWAGLCLSACQYWQACWQLALMLWSRYSF